ncbi:hypothetical protein [Alicycliphilus denitrificans]|uniref:hypothetical protein n=1 Tax=Alicycliphilus denitrificans TaxID=179636 RepID=UPI000C9F90BF|nr:hypothetical protein [Alicycliphilus denitrificans]
MAIRRPLVRVGGRVQQLPPGDSLPGAGAAQTGDLAFSVDPARYALPDWLPCNGAFVADADAPGSLQQYMARASGVDFSADATIESAGAAPQGVLDITDEFALLQMSASPYAIPLRKSTIGYSYTRDSWGANPTVAFKCAALGTAGAGTVAVLGFSTAAGGAFYARALSSTWSTGNVASIFTGKTVAGVVSGADGRFYLLSNVAPYLHSIAFAGTAGTLVDEGGVGASGAGLCISPNKRYMVSWHNITPYIYVFEFDGTKYVPLGSPPISTSGTSTFSRAEVSDTGVIVARTSSGSVFYVCSVTATGAVGSMVQTTVNAATAWGLMPDGRNLITWVSNAANCYPIANDTIGAGAALSMYSTGSYGTLYGRFGLIPGRLLTASSVPGSGYAMTGDVTPSGWIAPRIKYGFMKV